MYIIKYKEMIPFYLLRYFANLTNKLALNYILQLIILLFDINLSSLELQSNIKWLNVLCVELLFEH